MSDTRTAVIEEAKLIDAAQKDMDAFIGVVIEAIKQYAGPELCAESMEKLSADQITLWGYKVLHEELMDGGFVQLIHNGYGPFFFDNPFAKALRLWGLKDFSKLIYKAKTLYDENKEALTAECSDEEFMALFEQFPQFDDLDDEFMENEEAYTSAIAHYVDEHLENFVEVIKQ